MPDPHDDDDINNVERLTDSLSHKTDELERLFTMTQQGELDLTALQDPSLDLSDSVEDLTLDSLDDDDQEPALTMHSPAFTPSLTAIANPLPAFFPTDPFLMPDQKKQYDSIFAVGDDPYSVLAKMIQHQNELGKTVVSRKHNDFASRLKNINAALEFAALGAKEEYRLGLQAKLPANELHDLKQKMDSFDEIKDMMLSLRALNKNRSRYEQDHFDKRLQELENKWASRNISNDAQDELLHALHTVVDNNIFNNRKKYQSTSMGSTPFNASSASSDLSEFKKRVKIEHKDNGQQVSAIFSYSRNKLLGHMSGKIWGTRAGEFKEFRAQIRDLVNVGISEYNKGSKANPIKIAYIGAPQPEAALMLLMEYKKKAVAEGRSFHAMDHNGNPVEITPNRNFSAQEKEYFLHFALEKPKMVKGQAIRDSNGPAGYKVFQHAIKMDKNTSTDPAVMEQAMKDFLDHDLGRMAVKNQAALTDVSKSLGDTARTDNWLTDPSPQRMKLKS